MSTPENDLVPSVSLSITSRDSVSRLSQATPELMNISPLSDNIPEADSQQKSVQELLQQRQWLHSQRNQLKSQIDAIESESASKLDTMSADELRKLYEQLKEDLLQRTAVHNGREMILKSDARGHLKGGQGDTSTSERESHVSPRSCVGYLHRHIKHRLGDAHLDPLDLLKGMWLHDQDMNYINILELKAVVLTLCQAVRECLNRATLSVLQCELSDQCDVNANKKRELEDILEEYTTLASQIAKQHTENVQLKDGLERVKTENFALLRKSRELYTEIGDKKSAKEEELKTLTTDSKGKSIHEQLQSKLGLNLIVSNTLQGLILGSGINWAQDEHLKTLMLDAGKHTHV